MQKDVKCIFLVKYRDKKDGVVNVIGHHFEPFDIDNDDIGIKSRDFR